MATQDETLLDEDSESCNNTFNFTGIAISLTGACKSLMLMRGFLACYYRAAEVKVMS